MAVIGQPKDPREALAAGRPLLGVAPSQLLTGFPYELLRRGSDDVVAYVAEGEDAAPRALAKEMEERWNLHHDLEAQVEALKTAVRGLLPLAQERATQFREHAKKLAEFVKETGTTPSDAVDGMRKLRETEAEGAELVLEQARQALKGAGHAA